jgi:small subunit ribosomal protein S1
VEARIIDVDARRRRLSLSLRPKREEREERPPRREERPPRREERQPRGDRETEGGLRTGAFDALSDLDLEEK